MVEPTAKLFYQWQENGFVIEHVRCDNAGENVKLDNRVKDSDWKMTMDFEYTPRNTPQYNHLAELKIHLICNKARALMIDANVPRKYRYRCFVLATSTAMMLDWLVTVDIAGIEKSRFEHCFGCLPKFATNLRTWGEAGVVTIKTVNYPAVQHRAVTCLFAGYLKDSNHDSYQMYEPVNNTIYRTRDIQWLGRMYFPKAKVPPVDISDNFADILDLQVPPIRNSGGDEPIGRITNGIPNEVESEADSDSESDEEPEDSDPEDSDSEDEIDPEAIDPAEPVKSDEDLERHNQVGEELQFNKIG